MHFFNLDLHCAVIEDVTRAFNALGHQVTSVNMTGHHWVFGRAPVQSFGPVKSEGWFNVKSEDFFRECKNELSKYDGFITTFPPLFARLYEHFDKPIIMYAPLRYEMPLHSNAERWLDLNSWIQKAVDQKQLFLTANSLYDAEYMAGFVERPVKYIPNLCDYTGSTWNPSESTALMNQASCSAVEQYLIGGSNGHLRHIRPASGRYRWSDIVKHRGFVHVPYNCGSMSFFEHYSMNAPLMVPTPEYLMSLKEMFSCVLCDIGWEARSPSIKSHHKLGDPNEFQVKWFRLFDFYNEDQYPHILYFESAEHMRNIIVDTTRLKTTSDAMKSHNVVRKQRHLTGWAEMLSEVENTLH